MVLKKETMLIRDGVIRLVNIKKVQEHTWMRARTLVTVLVYIWVMNDTFKDKGNLKEFGRISDVIS